MKQISHNTSQFFPWNNDTLVKQAYELQNYRVITTKASGNNALLLFSSNGIYYPNQPDVFKKVICEEDYYEWQNISSHSLIQKYFARIILLRDIYKQWYVSGINSSIDNIDRLHSFLEELLKGYQITVCGTSSGGYMAVLMGAMLNAKRIINNSGQFNLWIHSDPGPLVEKCKSDSSRSQYYDLSPFIEKCAERMYYFYPAKAEFDLSQFQSLDHPDRIKSFALNGSRHGQTVPSVCYPYLFTAEQSKLDTLYKENTGRLIDRMTIYRKTVPLIDRLFSIPYYKLKEKYRKK